MKTTGVILLTFLGVMIAWGNATGDGPLSTFDAATQVEAACQGTYTTTGACKSCVGKTSDALVTQGLITKKQEELIVSSFDAWCKAECIPTSCAIAGRTCGFILDGCNDNVVLNCGTCALPPPGPDLQICFCQDGTHLSLCLTMGPLCSSGIAQDNVCGPLCESRGGEFATGCINNDLSCVH